MSYKKLEHAPAHEVSLADAEIESRSTLAVQHAVRGKKKTIEDPTLGAGLTKKILQSAIAQLEEDKSAGADAAVPLPAYRDGDDDEDIVLDYETNDKEILDMFQMFSGSAATASKQLSKALTKTEKTNDPKIRGMYKELATVLRLHKSGKLPKAVNALASQKIPDWLDLLYLSEPLKWSPNALLAVTKLFAQTSDDKKCETFYGEVLLEYVEDALEKAKNLPPMLWKSLIAAARRPKCFIRGVLLPLSQSSCTQKEARIISLIVRRVKLPRDHANAFIIAICQGDISLVRTIFLAGMVSRGQALAIQAIDAILNYFLRFDAIDEKQPLLWHQALLDFVQKYGVELLFEQRDHLEMLLQKHKHEKITPEILKYLSEHPPREEFAHAIVENVPTF